MGSRPCIRPGPSSWLSRLGTSNLQSLESMTDVVQAFAALHLPKEASDDCFLSSPRHYRLQHSSSSLRATSLFPHSDQPAAAGKYLLASEGTTQADRQAAWSAIVGDLFQAVTEHLPAHTAQHAMLVCRQWHDSVTNGLVCLRPRALRLDCINSRYACFLQPSFCHKHAGHSVFPA